MKDKFREFGCSFKNESDCEEELDGEGLSLEDADKAHFDSDY